VKGLLVAGAGSGAGKTSVTVGVARVLVRRGIRVRCAKCGPDFLDPLWLAAASGVACWNLDPWMMGVDHVRRLADQAWNAGEFLLVEGAMGLYDGPDAGTDEGSCAHVAGLLGIATLLVLDAKAQARTFAAVVRGLRDFGNVEVEGVVANRVGSARHGQILSEALASASLPRLIGAIPNGGLPALASRHLGLEAAAVDAATVEAMADAIEEHLDVTEIVKTIGRIRAENLSESVMAPPGRVRLAVARDEAFHFLYADQIAALERRGVEIVWTSPLHDRALPERIHGLWLCGGYPEAHGQDLSTNAAYLADIAAFCASGRPVLAECGGMMLLCRSVVDAQGGEHPMAGFLEARAVLGKRLAALGYVEVEASPGSWLAETGPLRGHEFHWSNLDAPPDGWDPLFAERESKGRAAGVGWCKRGTLATWVHLHLASNEKALAAWKRAMEENEPWNA